MSGELKEMSKLIHCVRCGQLFIQRIFGDRVCKKCKEEDRVKE